MTQPEHRLAAKMEAEFGVGTSVSLPKITGLGKSMESLPYFDAGTYVTTLVDEGRLVKTQKGNEGNKNPSYKLVAGWDDDLATETIEAQTEKYIDSEQDTFASF